MQNIHLKIETGVHTSSIGKFCVTSDGSYFISSGQDKTIRVWDPIAQKEVRKFIGEIGDGGYGSVMDMTMTPDDQYVLAGIRRFVDGQFNDAIRIYEFETGKLLKQFDTGAAISSLSISHDNQYIAIGNFYGEQVNVWEVSTFLASDEFSTDNSMANYSFGASNQPQYLKIFKKDDDYFIVNCIVNYNAATEAQPHYIQLYSLNEAKFTHGPIDCTGMAALQIAVNQNHIAIVRAGHKIDIYDHQLNLIQEVPANATNINYSPNGKYLIRGFMGEEQCTVYDAENGYTVVSRLGMYKNGANGVAFLNNITAVTGGGDVNEIHFWNPQTGEQRGYIPGVGQADFAVGIKGSKIAFGSTQRQQLNQNNYAPIEKQFDLNDLLDDSFHVEEIDPDAIETFNRAVTEQDSVRVYIEQANLRTNQDYLSKGGQWFFAETFGLTDKGLVVTGNRGGGGYCAHPNGTFLAQFKGHNNTVWDLAVDGNRMVTCSEDQIIRIWNLDEVPALDEDYFTQAPGEVDIIMPMLNIFITEDNEWIVWSHAGFYAASLYGDKYIGYHVNQAEDQEALFFPSDRFVDSLYRPDVIKEIIKTGSEATALANLDIDIQQIQDILPAQIEVDGPEQLSTENEVYALTFRLVLSNDQPIEKVIVFNNDQPVWQMVDQNITQSASFTTDEIHLWPGENKLKLLAYGEHSKSVPKLINITRTSGQVLTRAAGSTKVDKSKFKQVKPNLYLLSVGVSEYKNADGKKLKNLRGAHNDATKLAEMFAKQNGRAFNKVQKAVLVNKKATKENILKALKAVKKEIQVRETEKKDKKQISRDVFMVFLAGHGIKEPSTNAFYFLPHDADLKKVKTTGLFITEIGNIMNEVSTEFVILMDACHAGAASGHFNTLEFTKRWLATHDRAQLIFSATTASAKAIEKLFNQHGIFTLGILEELKSSKKASAIELCYKVSDRVKVMSNDKQTPAVTVYGSLIDYEIFK